VANCVLSVFNKENDDDDVLVEPKKWEEHDNNKIPALCAERMPPLNFKLPFGAIAFAQGSRAPS